MKPLPSLCNIRYELASCDAIEPPAAPTSAEVDYAADLLWNTPYILRTGCSRMVRHLLVLYRCSFAPRRRQPSIFNRATMA